MDRIVFVALVASLPVMQPPLTFLGPYPVVVSDALFVILAVLVAAMLARGRMRMAWGWWHSFVVAFVAANFLSAAASDLRLGLLKAAGAGYLGCVAILSAHYAESPQMRRPIVLAWLAGALATIIAAAVGVGLFLAGRHDNAFLYGYGSLIPGGYPRVMALFLNANMLCSYVGAAVFILLGAAHANLISRRVARATLVALALVAVLTLSPGLGGLALAVSLWLTCSHAMPPVRAGMLRGLGVAMAVASVLAILPSPTMLQATNLAHFEPSSRLQTWADASKTFFARPLLGAGPGAEVAHVTYVNASHQVEHLTDAHNTWLSVLAQTGLIGFACFALVIGMLIRRMRFDRDFSAEGAWRTGVELALLASVLIPSLSGSFEDARHGWVLLGMVYGAQQARPAVNEREINLQMPA
ncbi:MAG: O-antigen ligase family protein [Vicinamibacterales bacterium]